MKAILPDRLLCLSVTCRVNICFISYSAKKLSAFTAVVEVLIRSNLSACVLVVFENTAICFPAQTNHKHLLLSG